MMAVVGTQALPDTVELYRPPPAQIDTNCPFSAIARTRLL